jgi:hypothetical protein
VLLLRHELVPGFTCHPTEELNANARPTFFFAMSHDHRVRGECLRRELDLYFDELAQRGLLVEMDVQPAIADICGIGGHRLLPNRNDHRHLCLMAGLTTAFVHACVLKLAIVAPHVKQLGRMEGSAHVLLNSFETKSAPPRRTLRGSGCWIFSDPIMFKSTEFLPPPNGTFSAQLNGSVPNEGVSMLGRRTLVAFAFLLAPATYATALSAEEELSKQLTVDAALKDGVVTVTIKGTDKVYVNKEYPSKAKVEAKNGGTVDVTEVKKDAFVWEESGKEGKAKSAKFTVKAPKGAKGIVKIVGCTVESCGNPVEVAFETK